MVLLLSFHCDWPLGVPPAALFPLLLATSACCRENRYRPRVGWDGEHALPGSSVGPRWGWSHEIFCRCPGVPHLKKKNMVLFGEKQLGLSVYEVLSFSYLIIYPWQANCSGSFQQKFPRRRFHRDIHHGSRKATPQRVTVEWDVLPQTICSKIYSLVDQTSPRFTQKNPVATMKTTWAVATMDSHRP